MLPWGRDPGAHLVRLAPPLFPSKIWKAASYSSNILVFRDLRKGARRCPCTRAFVQGWGPDGRQRVETWDDEFSASQVLRRPSPNKVARAAPTFFLASLLEKQKLRTGEAHSLGHTRPWRLAALTAGSLAPGPSTRCMEVAHGELRLLEMPRPVRDTLVDLEFAIPATHSSN